MKNSRNWIGGEWIEPTAGECAVFSPSNTKEQVGVLHLSDSSQVVQAEQAARIAYGSWSGLSGPARAGHLERMADLLTGPLCGELVQMTPCVADGRGDTLASGNRRGDGGVGVAASGGWAMGRDEQDVEVER